jgi:two-component system, NtrC family, response regulator AtoC
VERIFLVDDDENFARTTAALLTAEGYSVTTELSYVSAMRTLSNDIPDAVITDLRFDDGDGWDIVQYVRQRRPDVPIVIVSGYYDTLAEENARRLAVAVLTKPFEPDDLIELLRSLHKT